MNPGELNRIITITELTETVSAGDVVSVPGSAATIRAKVTQVDGTRFLKEDELIDRAVYKIQCWDNSYTNNMEIGFEGKTLYPIRPLTKNPGTSNLTEVIIICATKK